MSYSRTGNWYPILRSSAINSIFEIWHPYWTRIYNIRYWDCCLSAFSLLHFPVKLIEFWSFHQGQNGWKTVCLNHFEFLLNVLHREILNNGRKFSVLVLKISFLKKNKHWRLSFTAAKFSRSIVGVLEMHTFWQIFYATLNHLFSIL